MRIIKNPDLEKYNKATQAIKENNNYRLDCKEFIPENRCPCKQFIECDDLGECECGRYVKIEK